MMRWFGCLLLIALPLAATFPPAGRVLAQEAEPDFSAELPRIPPKEPAEAMQTFEVLPGFRLEQAAAEPLVCDPVAMAFDERSRLFVVEMRDYSEQDKDFLGVIRLLEDTDSDGRFDKSTVYCDELSWPTAAICSAVAGPLRLWPPGRSIWLPSGPLSEMKMITVLSSWPLSRRWPIRRPIFSSSESTRPA
jgi:hypothetical protein